VPAGHPDAFDTRHLRSVPLDRALKTLIDPTYASRGRFGWVFDRETQAYAALTFGDLLYDWVRIDPRVVEALDFVHVADLADTFSFARYADSLQALSDAARLGNVTQLQGYVAERMAAGMLRAQGAEVEIPASPSQPGYDLIVNGQHCQIKCLDDPSGVYAHLGRYPDVLVLVNEELAKHFAEDDRVMALPGLNHDQVRETTESSLGAGADLLDLEIPLISTTLQAARNAIALVKNHTDWRAVAENLGIDVGARIAGGKAGAVAVAATVGLIGITGGWFVVVAPMLGAVGGYAGGKRMAEAVKRHLLCRKEADDLASALSGYVAAAISGLRAMIARAEEQSGRFGAMGVASCTAGLALIQDWQQRIEVENSIRMAMIREFESRASRLDHRWPICLDLIAVHTEVCLNAAKAALLPVNLASETRCLTKTSAAYQTALRKRLVAA
jgi:hypothetical protein